MMPSSLVVKSAQLDEAVALLHTEGQRRLKLERAVAELEEKLAAAEAREAEKADVLSLMHADKKRMVYAAQDLQERTDALRDKCNELALSKCRVTHRVVGLDRAVMVRKAEGRAEEMRVGAERKPDLEAIKQRLCARLRALKGEHGAAREHAQALAHQGRQVAARMDSLRQHREELLAAAQPLFSVLRGANG
ncbi:hypothetical protein DIPPA_16979 [Diplonema papillatum]|nr:hypothetical protein DIPPA_16979 [Diplonema papillatum]